MKRTGNTAQIHSTNWTGLSLSPQKASPGGKEDCRAHTRHVWQRLYGTQLNEIDITEITQNLSAFFDLLAEWDRLPDHPTSSPIDGDDQHYGVEK